MAWFLRAASWCAVLALAGCGPSVLLERPEGWPLEWSGRRLFNTPVAYIYASSPGAAREVDRLALAVEKDFREGARARPTKGLLIVTDRGDGLIISDPKTLFGVWARSEVSGDERPEVTEEDMERRWKEQTKEMSAMGIDPTDMLKAMPLPLSPAQARSLVGFGREVAGEVPWALALPTRAALREYAKKMLLSALEKEGMGPVLRFALAPFLSLAESKVTDSLGMALDVALFARWVSDLTDRGDGEKAALVEAYLERKKKEVLGSLGEALQKPRASLNRPSSRDSTTPGPSSTEPGRASP